MNYKVLITTSGVGSRLGELTDYTNKCLIRVGKKPAISYIIDSYPKGTNFVITTGYYGKHVIDFISLAYPNLKVEFIEIDNYKGPGSSLVYSLSKAKNNLKCPFVFHACDTIIVDEEIPEPTCNWVAGYNGKDSKEYRSLKVNGCYLDHINSKGELYFDLIHIGLIGVFNYEDFFNEIDRLYENQKENDQLSDCDVINNMMKDNIPFKIHETKTWLDIGNIDGLKKARNVVPDKFSLLDKPSESIFLFEDSVVKFFHDKKTNDLRIKRASEFPKGTIPEILGRKDNFYKYRYVDGEVFSHTINESKFLDLLDWGRDNLWRKLEPKNDPKGIFEKFYIEKTKSRVQDFLIKHNLKDQKDTINGIKVPSIEDMIKSINVDLLCNSEPHTFHGDFILDNIIESKSGDFVLIDWRQDFGGQTDFGDMYYDLSKLNHSLTLSHKIINDNGYSVNFEDDGSVYCDLLVSNLLLSCKDVLFYFAKKNGYNIEKIRLLTPIIWINMSPLHEYPFDKFLFYFGKLNLFKELTKSE